MPLASGGPVTTKALLEDRKRFAAYGWSDALGYVFRGSGSYVFWSVPAVLAAMTIIGQITRLGILSGCMQLLFGLVVLVILPGTLFAVVRETAKGNTELPDWLAFHSFGERFSEVFEFILVGLVAFLPGALAMRLLGCFNLAASSSECWPVLAASWVVATLIWIPAFGSVAVYGNFLLAFRVDLHYRAVSIARGDYLAVVLMSIGLVLPGQALALVLLGVIPFLGMPVSAIVGLYSWLTIAHLVGVLFRRQGKHFDAIYRG